MFQLKRSIGAEHSEEGQSTAAKFSPDGKYLAIIKNLQIVVYDTVEFQIATTLFTTHTSPISDICWSPDSQCVATASNDFTMEIIHLVYGSLHRLISHTAPVLSLCFNGKGNLLFSSSMDESIKIWDVLNGTLMKTISAHSEAVVSIDVPTLDSSVLGSGSYDGLIRIFDTTTGHCLKTLTYDKDWKSETGVVPISNVKFSKNAKYLLVKSLDGIVKIWDCIRGDVVRTFSDGSVKKLKYTCGMDFFYPNDSEPPLVVSGYEQGEVYCWKTDDKTLVQTIPSEHHLESPIINIHCTDKLMCTLSLNGQCHIWQWQQ
ncbi:hypothetical protein KAFR_0I00640 [Kazachstania africana CBS 2517]|uniref:Uncharacterized protein n=1 Tax=Kazachstania africana (strain ATCC 22294 / BCRC 22015 / CBS 2517 / CECT 1963 / NBRC 1671 / NRRL Y-8276) TaxID=1071382 RepID=H2AZP5_KAZAF|nr:hypothetical protein KAFR_0I00640 [Kazachstania africana CBS 2517]CCF59845.1 hypothetical protein KAFR_0I00640 [Kazachstania africana CBS 2517]